MDKHYQASNPSYRLVNPILPTLTHYAVAARSWVNGLTRCMDTVLASEVPIGCNSYEMFISSLPIRFLNDAAETTFFI